MPNIAILLKQEITRLARKELRTQVEPLKQSLATHKAENAKLRLRLATLEKSLAKALKQLERGQPTRAAAAAAADDQDAGGRHGLRFSAKGLASNRKRLGLSAEDYGSLVGVTGQSIYAWEAGRSLPRAKQLSALAALRGLGKKAVRSRLAELQGQPAAAE